MTGQHILIGLVKDINFRLQGTSRQQTIYTILIEQHLTGRRRGHIDILQQGPASLQVGKRYKLTFTDTEKGRELITAILV